MKHLEQDNPPAASGRLSIAGRGALGRRLARAEMAVLLLLAALPFLALWSPVLLGGGAVPAA